MSEPPKEDTKELVRKSPADSDLEPQMPPATSLTSENLATIDTIGNIATACIGSSRENVLKDSPQSSPPSKSKESKESRESTHTQTQFSTQVYVRQRSSTSINRGSSGVLNILDRLISRHAFLRKFINIHDSGTHASGESRDLSLHSKRYAAILIQFLKKFYLLQVARPSVGKVKAHITAHGQKQSEKYKNHIKYSISVELAPIVKLDLCVFLDSKSAQQKGYNPQMPNCIGAKGVCVIYTAAANNLVLYDPVIGRTFSISPTVAWASAMKTSERYSLRVIGVKAELKRFVVMEVVDADYVKREGTKSSDAVEDVEETEKIVRSSEDEPVVLEGKEVLPVTPDKVDGTLEEARSSDDVEEKPENVNGDKLETETRKDSRTSDSNKRYDSKRAKHYPQHTQLVYGARLDKPKVPHAQHYRLDVVLERELMSGSSDDLSNRMVHYLRVPMILNSDFADDTSCPIAEGDVVLGYDLRGKVGNELDEIELAGLPYPSVVLVRKVEAKKEKKSTGDTAANETNISTEAEAKEYCEQLHSDAAVEADREDDTENVEAVLDSVSSKKYQGGKRSQYLNADDNASEATYHTARTSRGRKNKKSNNKSSSSSYSDAGSSYFFDDDEEDEDDELFSSEIMSALSGALGDVANLKDLESEFEEAMDA